MRRRFRSGRSWRWGPKRRVGLFIDLDLDMLNLPRIAVDDERRWVTFTWGNGYSDPVLMVEVHFRR